MPLTYTTTTQDTPEYKPMLCGRTPDITVLIDHIVQGQSVALFGERKIGKTSLLYLMRDIINDSIGGYQVNLIDTDLKNALATLRAKTLHYSSCYVNLQSFQQYDYETFLRKIYRGGQDVGLMPPINPAAPALNYKEMELFEKLNTACGQGRLVVLIDEIEVLENFHAQERMKIVRNLRNATSYANLCFVIAGAENWYSYLKDVSSPLSGVLKKYTLPIPSPSSIEPYLIREPLDDYFSRAPYVNKIVITIRDWTRCKPFYVQAICASVIEIYQKQGHLPQDWQRLVLQDVYGNTPREVLDQFYGADNIDELAQNILALLANTPGLTIQQIVRLLGYDRRAQVIKERLNDLITFSKISQQDGKYRIIGTLIEQWGREHKEIPPAINPWSRRGIIALKLALVAAVLVISMWALIYANPSNEIVQFKFADGTLVLEVPASLEEDQKDTMTVSVQNSSPNTIPSMHVSITSTDIDYQLSNSNRLAFKAIDAEEQQFIYPTFAVHSSLSASTLTSQVIITEDGKPSRIVQTFAIPKRYPIRKYGALVGILLTILAGLAVGKDLWHFIVSAKSTVTSGKSDSTKSDG